MTLRTPKVMESMHNSQINSKNAGSRRKMIDTNSAPCTPTGLRHCADAYKREVPIPIFRRSSFGSDALSRCTPDYPDGIARSVSSSSSSSVTSSSNLESTMNNSIRSVNLFDLIDEEFVVNCGASLGNRCEIDERIKRRDSFSSDSPSRPLHRRRKSILDMIDRIGTTSEDSSETDSSVMTTRLYPRGVFVVPPKERETIAVGNTVAFVSAEAYNQW